jgi:FtsP/CotA-like multicopper oxidase with cupredoxin domain
VDYNIYPFKESNQINIEAFVGFILSGKTYKFRVSNVGIATSINFRIQGHVLKLIEVEGAHTLQEIYESIDVHVGQSIAVLVTLNESTKDYFIVASTRFTKPILNTTATLRYAGSNTGASGPLPIGPTYQIHWSMKQARTIRYDFFKIFLLFVEKISHVLCIICFTVVDLTRL